MGRKEYDAEKALSMLQYVIEMKKVTIRGLPFRTSALRGEGGTFKSRHRKKRGRLREFAIRGGSKNPKFLRTSLMEAPFGPGHGQIDKGDNYPRKRGIVLP